MPRFDSTTRAGGGKKGGGMSKPITSILDEIETALKKTTPGEWKVEDPMGDLELSIVIGDDPLDWQFIASAHNDGDMVSQQTEANAAFIALTHNHLADVLAELRRQAAQIDLLQQSLARADERITKLKLYGVYL